MTGGRIRVDRVYPHAPAVVWRALTDAELLGRWLMPNDMRPELGHRFTFRTEPGPGFDGIVHCEVLELEPERSMVWSWKGGPLDTLVRFELHPTEDGCRLVVEHTGFRGIQSRLVGWILRIGNRTLYGKRLPALLAELDPDAGIRPEPTASTVDGACMSAWQRIVVFFVRLVPGHRRTDPHDRS